MRSICCFLGAGYAHVAGAPLTRDLFATRNVAVSSGGAARRFQAVWDHHEEWLSENHARNAEEYLADLLKQHESTVWSLSERYALQHSSLERTGAIEARQAPLPFSIPRLPSRAVPPFEWAVELLGAALASPLSSDTTKTNCRYGARITFPFHCGSHSAFWREVTASQSDHVAAITTNYDILIERQLRHRRMRRTFGPGCYYGGLPKPQLLRGTQLPWAYQGTHVTLEGAIPIYKLHGSLNWSLAARELELFQDMRPAFRQGGNAAIIPPVPEKDIPPWLSPVWKCAEQELAGAEVWIICGYSLPSYDIAVIELLRRAAAKGYLTRVLVLDPRSSDICRRYAAIMQNVEVIGLEGLPGGVDMLHKLL